MRKKIDPVVDEAIETLNMKDGPSRRRLLEGAGLFSATAAASALIAACSSSTTSSAAPNGTASAAKEAAGNFPTTPKWKFTFVNHVTDNAFFTPTQYGFQDAAALLGIETPAWTGALSTQPTNSTMLSAFNAAVTANSPGIATTVVSATAFTAPINSALQAGVPVVTYNANGSVQNPTNGLAYIGQELYISGQAVGTRLASLMTKGDNTGASATQEAQVLPQFLQSHGSSIKGAFAVDGGDTALLGTSLAKYNLVGKVHAGGFDLEPQTLTAIKAGQIDFTVDQQPYLQGFLPTLYLYLFQLSGGLVAPPETNTGLKFVTKSNADSYTAQPTRFEGSTSKQVY